MYAIFSCRRLWVPLGTLLVVGGIGAAEAATVRVAVLPLTSMAAGDAERQDLRRRISSNLTTQYEVEVVDARQVDDAVRARCGEPAAWWDCLEQETVLLQLGRRLRADTVVTGRLATMGVSKVLRLVFADVRSATTRSTLVHIGASDERFFPPGLLPPRKHADSQPTSQEVSQRIRQQPTAKPRRWYHRWQVWAATAAGVALVTGLVVYAASASSTTTDQPRASWDYQTTFP